MIETVMIFALGFLVASLCALLFVPILNKRALRLARRRLDGLFPMSVKEITAERDALRADFAVAQRRMERRVEEAQARRHAEMKALGARMLEIAALAREVETRDATLAERKAEIERALARIAGLDHDLAELRSAHKTGLAALAALEEAHQETIVDLKTMRRERDSARRDLYDALATEEGSAAHARIKERDARAAEATRATAALHDLRAEHDSVLADRESLRKSLRTAEEALSRALAERGDGSDGDIAELRRRILEVADALMRRDRLPAVGTFQIPAAAHS